MSAFTDELLAEFAPYRTLSPLQLEQLERHYDLLSHWNKTLNLTRIEDLKRAVQVHYCESLLLGNYLPAGPLRIADVGSGAGFPGIPVAILRPDCQVDLIESHRRKAVFLTEASRGLPNVRVLPTRAEECRPEYDWIVSRAVRPADVVAFQLAPNAALLMSLNDASGIGGQMIPLPWGHNHVLVLLQVPRGTVKDNVPRETRPTP